MQIAQRLFQGVDIGGGDLEGLISYHRTDSTTLSDKALREAGQAVTEMYGAEYYKGPRQYQTKVRNAQEAHEAIRPTDSAARRSRSSAARNRRAEDLRSDLEARDRVADGRSADAAHDRRDHRARPPTASRRCSPPAARRSSSPATCAPMSRRDDPAAELDEQETLLPKLAVGEQIYAPDNLDARSDRAGLDAKGHQTTPPARYTEASLVKRLEEEGIGRPSTYAPTVGTIQRRGYVSRQGKALVPSFTAFAVTRLLREHFGDYVDIGFTAEMEEILDHISNGEKDWLDFIREFYRGDGKHHGLENLVEDKDQARSGIRSSTCATIRTADCRCTCASAAMVRSCRSAKRRRPARLAARRSRAGRSHVREGRGAAEGEGGGPAVARASIRRPASTVYVMLGRFGAYVQLGETPEESREAAARVARPRLQRRHASRSRRRSAAVAAARARQGR